MSLYQSIVAFLIRRLILSDSGYLYEAIVSKKTPMNRMVQVQVLCTAHRAESLLHKPSTDVLGCAKTLRLLLVILSRFHFHAFRRPVPLKLPGRCTMRIRRKRKSLRQLYASKLHGVTLEGYPCQVNDVRRPGGLRSQKLRNFMRPLHAKKWPGYLGYPSLRN